MCPRCELAYGAGRPHYFTSDPKCAFVSGMFSSDNWQCRTASSLRALLDGTGNIHQGMTMACQGLWRMKTRLWDDSAGILYLNRDDDGCGYVFLAWYKNRGKTDMIFDDNCNPLSLKAAESILQYAEKQGWKLNSYCERFPCF